MEAAPHARAADIAILEALPKPKRRALLDILQALTPAIDAAHAIDETGADGRKARKKKKKARPVRPPAKTSSETPPVKVSAAKPGRVRKARSKS